MSDAPALECSVEVLSCCMEEEESRILNLKMLWRGVSCHSSALSTTTTSNHQEQATVSEVETRRDAQSPVSSPAQPRMIHDPECCQPEVHGKCKLIVTDNLVLGCTEPRLRSVKVRIKR